MFEEITDFIAPRYMPLATIRHTGLRYIYVRKITHGYLVSCGVEKFIKQKTFYDAYHTILLIPNREINPTCWWLYRTERVNAQIQVSTNPCDEVGLTPIKAETCRHLKLL